MAKGIITNCNQCEDETNHHILFKKRIVHVYKSENNRDSSTKDIEDYMIIQCKGCNTISFLRRDSGSFYDSKEEKYYMDYNFPEIEFSSGFRFLSQEEQDSVPYNIRGLYQELELVFENEGNKLAGVGLRMLVEAICLEQKIMGSNLKIKIEKLHDKGLISKNEIPILDKLREMGNTSAHEIKSFPLDKLEYALDILNHVLKSIYVLPKINRKLKI